MNGSTSSGEDVQVDDAAKHDGQNPVRVSTARTYLILHDQLRRGGDSRRFSCSIEPKGPSLRPVQRSR